TRQCSSANGRRHYCHPDVFPGVVAKLYRNRGRPPGMSPGEVQFEDVTLSSGLGQVPGPGLGVACADFNGDGWPDILVANDSKANRLWINQKNGTFKEEAVAYNIAFNNTGNPQANMGIALGDLTGEGRWAVFMTHLTEETHTLW